MSSPGKATFLCVLGFSLLQLNDVSKECRVVASRDQDWTPLLKNLEKPLSPKDKVAGQRQMPVIFDPRGPLH